MHDYHLKNGAVKCIFIKESFLFWSKFHGILFLDVQWTIAFVWIAWCPIGDKKSIDEMMIQFTDVYTVKSVYNDHLYNEMYYLWVIQ